jgi:hypothetical protein
MGQGKLELKEFYYKMGNDDKSIAFIERKDIEGATPIVDFQDATPTFLGINSISA